MTLLSNYFGNSLFVLSLHSNAVWYPSELNSKPITITTRSSSQYSKLILRSLTISLPLALQTQFNVVSNTLQSDQIFEFAVIYIITKNTMPLYLTFDLINMKTTVVWIFVIQNTFHSSVSIMIVSFEL